MPRSILELGNFFVDEKSVGLNVIKSSKHLSELLYDVDGKYDHETHAKRLGMTLDEYVRKYRREYGKTADETYQIEADIYASCNLRLWAKYQMTYIIKKSTATNYTRAYVTERPNMKELKLPFPAVMIVLDLDDYRDEGHNIAYIVCRRGDKFDVTVIADGEVYYCPICDETMVNLQSEKTTEYGSDPYQRYFINLAWHTILFLAAYNRDRKIISTRRIKLKGKNGIKAEPSDYFFDSVVCERVMYTSVEDEGISEPGSALNIEGLIPPDERTEEIVIQNETHESPKRHMVAGHYRTYWTGKGRKNPVRKFVESFERGGRINDKMFSRVKIYE